MRKGVMRKVCNGDTSTCTLDQLLSATRKDDHNKVKTLEEMIMDIELEEDRAKNPLPLLPPGRMSCVNNADILRSARNALNQYPRFSLDGKDAMYRSSFRTHHEEPLHHGLVRDRIINNNNNTANNQRHAKGLVVVWCKPGVVAKLMGLDAMPYVPHPTRTTLPPPPTGGAADRRRRRQVNNTSSTWKPTPPAHDAATGGGWPTRRLRF